MLKNLKQTDTNSPRPTAHQVLVNEPPRLRLVIPHQVVMQPGFFIEVLVLQSERLMRIPIDALILFQTTPGSVFAVPKQIAMDVGHLARDADLVVVEIGEVLPFVLVVVEDLGQGFVAAFVGVLLQ